MKVVLTNFAAAQTHPGEVWHCFPKLLARHSSVGRTKEAWPAVFIRVCRASFEAQNNKLVALYWKWAQTSTGLVLFCFSFFTNKTSLVYRNRDPQFHLDHWLLLVLPGAAQMCYRGRETCWTVLQELFYTTQQSEKNRLQKQNRHAE